MKKKTLIWIIVVGVIVLLGIGGFLYIKRIEAGLSNSSPIQYYYNGINEEGFIVNGKKHGERKYYDKEGNLTKVETYENGELITPEPF